jgi:hypothetical protein
MRPSRETARSLAYDERVAQGELGRQDGRMPTVNVATGDGWRRDGIREGTTKHGQHGSRIGRGSLLRKVTCALSAAA